MTQSQRQNCSETLTTYLYKSCPSVLCGTLAESCPLTFQKFAAATSAFCPIGQTHALVKFAQHTSPRPNDRQLCALSLQLLSVRIQYHSRSTTIYKQQSLAKSHQHTIFDPEEAHRHTYPKPALLSSLGCCTAATADCTAHSHTTLNRQCESLL